MDTINTLQRESDQMLVSTPGSALDIATSRAAQEVQAAMVVAKKFPRDERAAMARIERACTRPGLAAKSQYHFPRGKEEISGPTIRLAEVLAQAWGNIDYGTIELEQRDGESLMMAYCWDLETNLRSVMLFVVPHIREKKSHSGLEQIALEGARDIYEMTANMGARRKRACILSVIPIDVQQEALELCDRTLSANFTPEKKDRMIATYQQEFGVTVEQLEQFIGRRAAKFDGGTYIRLRRVYETLHDGFATVADFFPPPAPTNGQPRSKFGFGTGAAQPPTEPPAETPPPLAPAPEAKKRRRTKKTETEAKAPEPAPPTQAPPPDPAVQGKLVTPEVPADPGRDPAYGLLACAACQRSFHQVIELNERYYCPYCHQETVIVADTYEGDDLLSLEESMAPPADATPQRWRCDKNHEFDAADIHPSAGTEHGLCPRCLSSRIEPLT